MGRGRSKGGEGRAWVGARLRTARVMGAMVAVARAEVLEAVARVVEARGRGAGEKVAWSGRWRRARMQPERACSITEKPSRMFRGNSSAIAHQLLGEPLRNRAQSRELKYVAVGFKFRDNRQQQRTVCDSSNNSITTTTLLLRAAAIFGLGCEWPGSPSASPWSPPTAFAPPRAPGAPAWGRWAFWSFACVGTTLV